MEVLDYPVLAEERSRKRKKLENEGYDGQMLEDELERVMAKEEEEKEKERPEEEKYDELGNVEEAGSETNRKKFDLLNG